MLTIEDQLRASIPQSSAEVIERAHERLVMRADREGLLDVAYRTLDTPVGSLLLAASADGLLRIAYEREDHDLVLDDLSRQVSPRLLRAPARLDHVARQLEQYFAGSRRIFDLVLDLRLPSGFRRQVLNELRKIGYGQTASYGDVAAATGSPRATRATGTACATNPLPIVIPCHRVVRSNGELGQYLGGIEIKRALLSLEMGRT